MIENNQPVVISRDESGNIIRMSKNPEYGFIKVEQVAYTFNGGWANDKTRTALISGEITKLQKMLPALEKVADTGLGGQIIITEQLDPFFNDTEHKDYERLRDKDLKMAGDTGVILKGVDESTGEERDIYRKSEYTTNMDLTDTLVSHINSDEIRAAQAGTSSEATKEEFLDAVKEADEESKEVEVEVEDESFEL